MDDWANKWRIKVNQNKSASANEQCDRRVTWVKQFKTKRSHLFLKAKQMHWLL
jgi:hypothetical protein